jgi:aminoglycoside 3-N-acetyltransferase
MLDGSGSEPPGAGWEKHDEADLVTDLRRLGVAPGGVLLVQSSLRSMGPVVGGAETVVRALRRVLGEEGTLVVYTATPENSLSSPAYRVATAGLDEAGLELFHSRMPAFDPWTTPCSPTVGRLAETVRTTPGALRSSHPQTSFAAVGPRAAWVVGSHPPESHLDDRSPLGRLYEADASALLVGIPGSLFTPYHLADCRVPDPPRRPYACVVRGDDGDRRWLRFEGVDLDDVHFPELSAAVQERVPFAEGFLGSAESFLVPVRAAVDAATRWLTEHSPAVCRA